jgi:hypothetical protein
MQLKEVRAALAKVADLPVSPAGRICVAVKLGLRGHRVRVLSAGDWLRVQGRVARVGNTDTAPATKDLARRILERNFAKEAVGLVREGEWLLVRCDLPPEADERELVDAIRRVARVADREELLWTGGDVE